MDALLNFLNHGLLPFVGRVDEVHRILSFWRSTSEARGVRAMLLSGEAGIGKSRLIEELLPIIGREGGAAIHSKLRPDSVTSLIPLLAQALQRTQTDHHLLRSEPVHSIASVTEHLRRIAHLRPTFLIIEDIHLLQGPSLTEFSSILGSLEDEPISILCAARPVELSAHGLLQRYLVERIDLSGLTAEDTRLLWERVFGEHPLRSTLDTLLDATQGNVLAIRAALRSAITSGALTVESTTRGAIVTMNALSFADSLGSGVQLLSEGMIAHLSPVEKHNAALLATLGEVFAPETAAEMLDDPENDLRMLTFKGIINRSVTPVASLPGLSGKQSLYTFSHSLLHRELLRNTITPFEKLVRIVAAKLPLYSVLPFELLTWYKSSATPDCELLSCAVGTALDLAFQLDTTTEWLLAMTVWHAAETMSNSLLPLLDDQQRTEWRIRIHSARISMQRRSDHTPEFGALAEELWEMTRIAADSEYVLESRIHSLMQLHRYYWRVSPDRCVGVYRQAATLIESYPQLRFSRRYINYLQDVLRAFGTHGMPSPREVEEHVRDILASPESTPEFRRMVDETITQNFVLLFDTPKELEQRFALMSELEEQFGRNPLLGLYKIILYYSTGRFHDVISASESVLRILHDHALMRNYHQVRLYVFDATVATGGNSREWLDTAESFLNGLPDGEGIRLRQNFANGFTEVLLYRGEQAAAREVMQRFSDPETVANYPSPLLVLLAEPTELHETINHILERNDGILPVDLVQAIASVSGEHFASEDTCTALRMPLLRMEDFSTGLGIMHLLDVLESSDTMLDIGIRTARKEWLLQALQWLDENRLGLYMRAIIVRYGILLNDRSEWEERAGRWIVSEQLDRGEQAARKRWRITMIGTITAQEQNGEIRRVRGARLCRTLGLLVANELLNKPMDAKEFGRLIADDEPDPEKARKAMNLAVHRLRDAFSTDIVLTNEETPRLNPDTVEVDLIEAHNALREATRTLRTGELMRTVPALRTVWQITNGEVPFPALYDELFESLRENLESNLRSLTMETIKRLQREGDPDSAEFLAKAAYEAMPEDEEILGP